MTTKIKTRSSNIELLRIFSMSMILCGHLLVHAIGSRNFTPPLLYSLLSAFCVCGVNLFFLISGYFGIKLSVKKVILFTWTIFFFRAVNVLMLRLTGISVSSKDIMDTIFFPISSSPYWFIQVYLLLMAVAPIVNTGISSLKLHQLRYVIALFSLITFYGCDLGHNISNSNGYTFLQGLYMYSVAGWLRMEDKIFNSITPFKGFVLWLLLCITGAVALHYTGVLSIMTYSSVIVVAAAVFLFIGFTKFQLKSRIINLFGTASLGCYLLQDGLFGWEFLYGWLNEIYITNNLGYRVAVFGGTFILFWVASVVLTPVEKRIGSMITCKLSGKCEYQL